MSYLKEFSSSPDIDSGISLISTDDWAVLSCFFKNAITNSPDTETKMRAGLMMVATDTFEAEFAETVALYKDLVALSNDFTFRIADEVLNLADDIVHYQAKVDVVYSRLAELADRLDLPGAGDTPKSLQEKFDALIKLWKNGQVSGNSDKIQERFKKALEDLILEAENRAKRAENLREDILGATGLKIKLQASKSGFDSKKEIFEKKFGVESPRVVDFKTKMTLLQEDLKGLRKKERDEVIAMGTSPIYLAIPIFGPLILLGVNLGVGIDLAITRAKIEAAVTEANKIADELGRAERFMNYYNNGKLMVVATSKGIENILPRVETLGLGWRAVAKDIRFIVELLSGPGRSRINDEDWFNFVTTLKTAQATWVSVAGKAEKLRTAALPVAANDFKDAMAQWAA